MMTAILFASALLASALSVDGEAWNTSKNYNQGWSAVMRALLTRANDCDILIPVK